MYFFQIFMKNLLHVHIWSKKHQFCQTYTILAKKVNRKPFFFSIFTKKIISLRPYDKKVHCLKKQTALMLIFGQKSVHFLKNTMLSCHFFQIFMKNPCCHAHIWSEKCKLCQNYLYYMPKQSIGCPFFQLFTKNHCCHSHILTKKRTFSEKKLLSCPYLVRKRQIFKNRDF